MLDTFDILNDIFGATKLSSSEVPTPEWIVKDMVQMVYEADNNIFNPSSKFLDPAVKSGRFLMEIYNCFFARTHRLPMR